MKRNDKIYNYILEKSKNFDRNTLVHVYIYLIIRGNCYGN